MGTIIDLDIWRAAALLVRQHGADAADQAAARADDLAQAGDLDGAAVWRRILAAIQELQKATPSDGEGVH